MGGNGRLLGPAGTPEERHPGHASCWDRPGLEAAASCGSGLNCAGISPDGRAVLELALEYISPGSWLMVAVDPEGEGQPLRWRAPTMSLSWLRRDIRTSRSCSAMARRIVVAFVTSAADFSCDYDIAINTLVPRGGIEPPTPGFSDPCSTN